MKDSLALARLFLTSPTKAAEACERPGAVARALPLYAVLAVAQLLVARIDPLSFLDPNAPVAVARGAGFWVRVGLWEPVLFLMTLGLAVAVLEWLREGRMPVRLATTAGWAAVPVAMLAYYAAEKAAPRGVYVAGLAAWLVPAVLVARRASAERWRRVAAFMLGLSALQLVVVAAELLIVLPLRSQPAFYALSLSSVAWMLVVSGVALRRLLETSTARASLGFLVAMLLASVVPALAFALGLMPLEVLKVMMYV